MKAVDISFGAVGFEPNSAADQIGGLDVARLRTRGVSEKVIAMYIAYRDRHYPPAGATPVRAGMRATPRRSRTPRGAVG